jgi:hypothetical protein
VNGVDKVPAPNTVSVPVAPAGLDTSRIALSRSPISLDYFAKEHSKFELHPVSPHETGNAK